MIFSRIKERREQLGMTQPQLADALGVSKGAIGNYETDANSPKASILYKVFDVLQCDANYIFQDKVKERKEWVQIPLPAPNQRALNFNGSRLFSFVYQRFADFQLCPIEHIAFLCGHVLPLKMSYVLSYDKSAGVVQNQPFGKMPNLSITVKIRIIISGRSRSSSLLPLIPSFTLL